MRVDVWLPLLGCMVLAAGARPLVRGLPPGAATRLLAALAVFGAMSTLWSVLLLAIGGLGRVDEVRNLVHVDARTVGAVDSVPRLVGGLAVVVLCGSLGRAGRTWAAAHRARKEINHALADAPAGLVVVSDPHPDAYAVAGPPGRIVVSTGMLGVLDAAERRVLLFHERAHLAHHHHRYLLWTAIAAAVNPMFLPLRAAVAVHVERWADETTAELLGRGTTARALARAALTGSHSAGILLDPPATGADVAPHVTDRVRALTRPPPAPRWAPIVPLLAVALAAVAALLDATAACRHLLGLM